MTIENIISLASTVGGGFIGGYLIAYFIRRILKLLMFIIGGILAILLSLQQQEIIAINFTKLQTYTDAIIAPIVNANTTTTSTNHFSLVIVFNKMLEESREYSEAVTAKGEPFSAESLFMALIFQQQQKMIDTLISKLSKDNKVEPKLRPIF